MWTIRALIMKYLIKTLIRNLQSHKVLAMTFLNPFKKTNTTQFKKKLKEITDNQS